MSTVIYIVEMKNWFDFWAESESSQLELEPESA